MSFCVNSCIFLVFGVSEDKRGDLTGSSGCQTHGVPEILTGQSTNTAADLEHQFHIINDHPAPSFEPCPGM